MEIITNGGFDLGSEGAGWNYLGEIVNDEAISHSPPNCLDIWNRGHAYQSLSTKGVLYYADSGSLTFWVKNRGDQLAHLLIQVSYSENPVLSESREFPSDPSQWHKVEIAISSEFPLNQISFTPLRGYILIDDVSIAGSRFYLFLLPRWRSVLLLIAWLRRVRRRVLFR